MKKRLFMLLALTMAASLAACGAGASGEPQESQPGNSSSSASQPLTPAEPDTMPDSSQEPSKGNANSTLVAYFSATGNTENVAGHLEAVLDADLYEIVPQEPYTSADLNYSSANSRAEREINDPSARPAISGGVDNMEDYDVVFLGYPIWWGQTPKIVYTFLESYDFSGKTMVPFATSGGSGIGQAEKSVQAHCPKANWKQGKLVNSGAAAWAKSVLGV